MRPDGGPSPSLARRITYGLEAARADPESVVFCSGGKGRFGPSEASVIAAGLAGEVAEARLMLDESSKDTLHSVIAAVRYARANDFFQCIICTDGYHLPRARLLFWLMGMKSKAGPFQRRRSGTRLYRLRMRLREVLAIPYNLAEILFRRTEREPQGTPPRSFTNKTQRLEALPPQPGASKEGD